MDIGKAFSFVNKDERWIPKIGVGVLMIIFSFLVVPPLILTGYSIAIGRRVMQGDKSPLPEWDDWGTFLADGFAVTIATFVYMIPLIFLMIGGSVLGGLFSSGFESDAGGAVFGGVMIVTLCGSALYAVAIALLTPAIYVQYIRKGTLGACFQLGEIIEITRSQLGNIIMSMLGLMGVALIASMLLLIVNIVPCLGQIVSVVGFLALSPYLQMAGGHLYGQMAAIAEEGDEPKWSEFE